MNAPAHYFHWGFVLISTTNLLVIILMIVVFAAAVLLPFPFGGTSHSPRPSGGAALDAGSEEAAS